MGDMKTPDFDDLLAAFDIPDMVDPKAAIESGHHDDQLKHSSAAVATSNDDAQSTSTLHDVGVSVIVKNVRNMESGYHGETLSDKNGHYESLQQTHSFGAGNGLQNGLENAISAGNLYNKNRWRAPREERQLINNQLTVFNQFSPISSAEEFEDDEKIEVNDPVDKQGGQSIKPTAKRENQNLKKTFDAIGRAKRIQVNGGQKCDQIKANKKSVEECKSKKPPNSASPKRRTVLKSDHQDCQDAGESSGRVDSMSMSPIKTKSSEKLSSCIAAIAALSAKKVSATDLSNLGNPTTQKESLRLDSNSGTQAKPHEQESALEFAKRLLKGQPESPASVNSEGSSNGSPSSSTDANQVIPKVRIKTIKTSSGQIKRTVTRVLPEFDCEGLRKVGNSPSIVANDVIFSSPTKHSLPTAVVATAGGPSIEITKQMTIKPVATAFLPVSAVKTAGSQIINLKLANNTTVKATVIPAASVQNASSAILKAANALQQKTVMVPASSLASAKLVPKAVHLSNLNLIPQSVSSAVCELQQALSTAKLSQAQVKQKAILSGRASKKVPRVQVFTSPQSSVVDAFNKVLSSINPVPVYVPNLSPPTSACISLPSHGYKCLECGDSFALEKSLTQHYERRSVRIEVTCNHCAKSLVFFNKCSLLSHARGHKDKGVVMQCSHLILKPIPTDQMIPTSPPSGLPNNVGATYVSQVQVSTSQVPGRVSSNGSQTAMISSPSSGALAAAVPLDEDASKVSRNNVKCMECNEMFQDDSSLAIHYQKAAEPNEQVCAKCFSPPPPRHLRTITDPNAHSRFLKWNFCVTGKTMKSMTCFVTKITGDFFFSTTTFASLQKSCTSCQMLLPNQCSFLSHQRTHQHKPPYICPECGASSRSIHFQSHITKNCLHYSRRFGYRSVYRENEFLV